MSREIVSKTSVDALAPAPTWALMGNNLETSLKFSGMLVSSGMLPRGLDTPAKALVVLLKGRELGLQPMVALSQIAVVQGKPTASSELLLALMLRAGIKHQWRSDPDHEHEEAVLWLQRPDGTEHIERFTIAEAKLAGLLGKDSWKNYPVAMLRARCVSKAARAFCPDATMGVSYTPEELGAEVNEEGEVVEMPSRDPRRQAFAESDAKRRSEANRPPDKSAEVVDVESTPVVEPPHDAKTGEILDDEETPDAEPDLTFLDPTPVAADDPLRAPTSFELKLLANAAEKVGALVESPSNPKKKAVLVSDEAAKVANLPSAGTYGPSVMTVGQIIKLTQHYQSLGDGGLGL